MTIEDLVKSVRQMSTAELEQHIERLRHSRTQHKEVSSKPQGRPTKKEDKKLGEIVDLFAGLSLEEQKELLRNYGIED